MSREAFIEAMRGVAHSVCVVTTGNKAEKSGATVSAFCSVSADPPTALVCLNSDSRIAEQVAANGVFTINVLPDNAEHTANRFAGVHDNEIDDRFDGIELSSSDTLAPVIEGATVFHCSVQEIVTAGTHRVVIGLVTESIANIQSPLTYREGAYHRVSRLDKQKE